MFPSSLAPDQLRYCLYPTSLRPGNGIRVLGSGDRAYEFMLQAIRGAQSEVELETYILADDRTGKEFQQALAERARAGVKVRVMFDGFGSATLPDAFVRVLREAGVETLEFRPLGPWRARWGWNRRDHRKILVVDRGRAFTGGVNVADEYRSSAAGGGNWQDMHAEVVGPVAADLHALFADTWRREKGGPIPPQLPPSLGREAEASRLRAELGRDVAAQVLGNHRYRLRGAIRKAYVHAIDRARERIVLANAYFVPDRLIRRALSAAARRGVDVQILVASETDVMPIYYASRATFQGLLAAGVRLYEMGGAVLHAKCASVDRRWGLIGSYNLDHRSFFHNLEAAVTFVDGAVSAHLEEALAHHRSLCTPVDPAAWPERPWTQKLLERFWYLFRDFL